MGARYSHVPNINASGNFSINFASALNVVTIVGAPEAVIDIVKQGITKHTNIKDEKPKDNTVTIAFELTKSFFVSKSDQFIAELVACDILQSLYVGGYDVYLTANIVKESKSRAVFVEKRHQPSNPNTEFCCISPADADFHDRLHFVNLPDSLSKAVKDAIREQWSYGIQRERDYDELPACEWKLKKQPWWSGHEVGANRNRLLLRIVRVMAQHKWILHCVTSLHSSIDSWFFRYDPDITVSPEQANSAFIFSLHSTNRLRLLDAKDDVKTALEKVVRENWKDGIREIKEDYHGSYNIEVNGKPWSDKKDDSINNKLLITVWLQTLRSMGWHVLETVNVQVSLGDKSIFVVVPIQPAVIEVFCLSPHNEDKLRFINAPRDLVNHLREVVSRCYTPGFREEHLVAGYHEMVLDKKPWAAESGYEGWTLITDILTDLSNYHWRVLCSADVSNEFFQSKHSHYPLDVNSIWLARLAQNTK